MNRKRQGERREDQKRRKYWSKAEHWSNDKDIRHEDTGEQSKRSAEKP